MTDTTGNKTGGQDQNQAVGQNRSQGGAQGQGEARGDTPEDDALDGDTGIADDPVGEDQLRTGSTLLDDDGNMDASESDDIDDLGDETGANA